jgi:hypothetical protein
MKVSPVMSLRFKEVKDGNVKRNSGLSARG